MKNRTGTEGIAPESIKTRKAREKLLKQVASVESRINPKALERKSMEIHRWIARHAPSRIVLRSKAISLFDENKNAADVSKKIEGLVMKLQQEMQFYQA